jgi:hypothetical protein
MESIKKNKISDILYDVPNCKWIEPCLCKGFPVCASVANLLQHDCLITTTLTKETPKEIFEQTCRCMDAEENTSCNVPVAVDMRCHEQKALHHLHSW